MSKHTQSGLSDLSEKSITETPLKREFKIPKDIFENKSTIEISIIKSILGMLNGKSLTEIKSTLRAAIIVSEYNSKLV